MNQWQNHHNQLRELAQAHRQQADFHQRQAQYHHSQATAHEQYASTQVNPPVYTPTTAYAGHTNQAWQGASWHHVATPTTRSNPIYSSQSAQTAWNNPQYTASHDIVSPAALVFHGNISPEAIQSLQEFQNPYNHQRSSHLVTHPVSHHALHAVDNANAIHRTGSAYFTT